MNELDLLRKELDGIDEELCKALNKRFSVVKKIGEYKKLNEIAVTDSERESAVYEHIGGLFAEEQQKNAAIEIYKAIITQSKNLQK